VLSIGPVPPPSRAQLFVFFMSASAKAGESPGTLWTKTTVASIIPENSAENFIKVSELSEKSISVMILFFRVIFNKVFIRIYLFSACSQWFWQVRGKNM